MMMDMRAIARRARRAKNIIVAKAKPTRIKYYPRDLHLGCGGRRAPGFCNVDITSQPSVDITDDVSRLRRFPDNYATSIYACHVLEHFSHAEAPRVLKTWYRVLAAGGVIRISVPDIDRIVKIYIKNWRHFQTDGNSPWVGLIYGGQTDQYDFHKTGWNFRWMSHIMRSIGYVDMQEYAHEPHFIGEEFWGQFSGSRAFRRISLPQYDGAETDVARDYDDDQEVPSRWCPPGPPSGIARSNFTQPNGSQHDKLEVEGPLAGNSKAR